MRPVFADTSFYVATLNPRDARHEQALDCARQVLGKVVTTEYVLVELGNWLSRSGDRALFITFWEELSKDQRNVIVPGSTDLLGKGVELYRKRADKDWSLTDCISFVVMREKRLSGALTADHHFEQAGFTILLR